MSLLARALLRNEKKVANWLETTAGPWLDERGSASYIGREGEPYLDRFYLARTGRASAFLHRLWQSDEAGVHCHPWPNVSIVLTGGYHEDHHDGRSTWRGPGSVIWRSAREVHRLRVDPDSDMPIWSLFLKGARVINDDGTPRRWGFLRQDLEWTVAGHDPSSYEFKGWLFPRPADPFREQHLTKSEPTDWRVDPDGAGR